MAEQYVVPATTLPTASEPPLRQMVDIRWMDCGY